MWFAVVFATTKNHDRIVSSSLENILPPSTISKLYTDSVLSMHFLFQMSASWLNCYTICQYAIFYKIALDLNEARFNCTIYDWVAEKISLSLSLHQLALILYAEPRVSIHMQIKHKQCTIWSTIVHGLKREMEKKWTQQETQIKISAWTVKWFVTLDDWSFFFYVLEIQFFSQNYVHQRILMF